MPTVLRIDGFAVRILTNDHDPSHVHVVKAGGEARIKLGSRDRAPEIMTLYKMSNREAARALEIVEKHNDELVEKWRDIHGK